jgi:hypothetical protein
MRNNLELRRVLSFDGADKVATFGYCVELAIRAFGGLLERTVATEDDLRRLTRLIDAIPSTADRTALWTEVSTRCWLNGHRDWCDKIVESKIFPVVQLTATEDLGYRAALIAGSAPALHCARSELARSLIAELPQPFQEDAWNAVLYFLSHRQLAEEPFEETPGHDLRIPYLSMFEMTEIMDRLEYDNSIYESIVKIVDSIACQRGAKDYSVSQKGEIARRLTDIVNRKLPTERRIRHSGFKIAALGQIQRLESRNIEVIEVLTKEAQKIGNVSDRVYVMAILASCTARNQDKRRKKLFEEALEIVGEIPVFEERLELFRLIAELTFVSDPQTCRLCLSKAMRAAVDLEESDAFAHQRRYLELAFRLDPALGSSLASLADDDPARAKSRTNLNTKIDRLRTERRLASQKQTEDSELGIPASQISSTAWSLLGQLNADRIPAIQLDRLLPWLEEASALPLRRAYPIVAWVIENTTRRMSNTDQAKTLLRPIFLATTLAAEMAMQLAREAPDDPADLATGTSHIISSEGEREKVLAFIQDWLSSNLSDYLKIADPYFSIDDLDILKLIQRTNSTCRVEILTSFIAQEHKGVRADWEGTFADFWRTRVSDQPPPDTDIVLVGVGNGGDAPIHDRWWVTDGSGLMFGTSANSVGFGKISEVSVQSGEWAAEKEAIIDQFLSRRTREYGGGRVRYHVFTLAKE